MKKCLPILAALTLFVFAPRLVAADAKAELQELVGRIKIKIQAGKTTESDLADDFKAFDTLLAEHKDEKTDDVAHILVMKALLYAEVLKDDARAVETLKEVKTGFPDTTLGKKADDMIAALSKQEESKKIQDSLIPGAQFPDFAETDLNGKPLSLTNYRGKLVMIDFWATWCGPCVGELPNVQKVYDKYHGKGFEIIGVSLDKDKDKLTGFIKEKNMTWSQYFDGQGWQNKLATKYGINSIPATYLLDKDGKIIAKGLRGEALEAAVAKALGTQ